MKRYDSVILSVVIFRVNRKSGGNRVFIFPILDKGVWPGALLERPQKNERFGGRTDRPRGCGHIDAISVRDTRRIGRTDYRQYLILRNFDNRDRSVPRAAIPGGIHVLLENFTEFVRKIFILSRFSREGAGKTQRIKLEGRGRFV